MEREFKVNYDYLRSRTQDLREHYIRCFEEKNMDWIVGLIGDGCWEDVMTRIYTYFGWKGFAEAWDCLTPELRPPVALWMSIRGGSELVGILKGIDDDYECEENEDHIKECVKAICDYVEGRIA